MKNKKNFWRSNQINWIYHNGVTGVTANKSHHLGTTLVEIKVFKFLNYLVQGSIIFQSGRVRSFIIKKDSHTISEKYPEILEREIWGDQYCDDLSYANLGPNQTKRATLTESDQTYY